MFRGCWGSIQTESEQQIPQCFDAVRYNFVCVVGWRCQDAFEAMPYILYIPSLSLWSIALFFVMSSTLRLSTPLIPSRATYPEMQNILRAMFGDHDG